MNSSGSAHPLRLFGVSGMISVLALVLVFITLGSQAAFLTLVLTLVEITFSFDNAILNARILAHMNKFWQDMFMTVGIVLAVFGMRIVFPILLVVITTGLGAGTVIDLALHHPATYASALQQAHPYIAAFGGMFLLTLSLEFFLNPNRKIVWISVIERPLQRIGRWWAYAAISIGVLTLVAIAPWNHHLHETLLAGSIGISLYLILVFLTDRFGTVKAVSSSAKQTLKAGLIGFLYLQVLDASFSLDGVIGAFAVTQDVILIAVGLGVGALWVRSLTLFMVRRQTLNVYRYLEHGAHYTIAVLATILLLGLFFDVPEMIAGVAGLIIVGLSVFSSAIEAKK